MSLHSDRFSDALTVLAGHGHIKKRLISAFDTYLSEIDDTALPPGARGPFSDLKGRMTRVAPANGEGAVCASVRKMSIPEADECARLLVGVYENLLRSGADLPEMQEVQTDQTEPVPAVLLKSL